MPGANVNDNNRAKEIKLLHLDHMQREILESVTNKFVSGGKITITEVVDCFASYVLKLTEIVSIGEKNLCDTEGKFSSVGESYLKKFTDAILICSKYFINYNKILQSEDVKKSIIKAIIVRNQFTPRSISELEYKIKIATYSMLEADKEKITDYSVKIEDFYFRSLVSVNPASAKRFFIDHVIGMICSKGNYTMSDILVLIDKYSKYLGKTEIDHNKVEDLIHKYSHAAEKIKEGFFHAAKIEIFKMMEGL